jgi:SNF2 family DNA or RNA helicase
VEDYVLHGTWLKQGFNGSGRFILWGEEKIYEFPKIKGRQAKIPKHPYSAESDVIEKALKDLAWSLFLDDFIKGEAVLRLPMAGKLPLPSYRVSIEFDDEISISEYKADIICLELLDAIKILSSIPIHAYDLPYEIGSDLCFWSASAKFVLHLISQHKFIPMLYEDGDDFLAVWEAVLDDMSDAEKVNKLILSMPDACRSVKSAIIPFGSKSKNEHEQPESYPQDLVLDFIKAGVNKWVRTNAGNVLKSSDIKKIKDTITIQWLSGLMAENGRFQAPKLAQSMKGFCKTLADWRSAGIAKGAMTEKFRPCFRLEPPEEDNSSWELRYFLQANDDLSLLVPADLVWKERKAKLKYLNRELESPQEQMLTGLGVASRIFTPIERSLRQKRPENCDLNVEEAYQFLSESSLLLQQSGFGVLAPPWWTDKKSQLKAKVSFTKTKTESTGILSLDSVLSYDWQMALGDDIITPEELEQLAKLKIPIVQMRGQWILLRPEDIKSAMEFFNKHGESGEFTLRDAVKLSLSESPQLEGIRIEGIETPKWLGTFIDELKGGIKSIDQPKEFVGQLRPYQLVGLSWLAFMRQYGLGACLADDMGLGKTVEVIAFLLNDKKQRKNKSVPNLLVCPTSVVGNWQREVTKFAPKLKVMIHHGGDRLSGKEFAESVMKYDLIITSYGLARRDAEDISAIDWKGVILDEAQNIKNPSSKIAQITRSLKSEYRYALTGTPVENRLMELWSIMEFLNPGYLGSQSRFNQSYVIPIERYGEESATKELRSIAAPFIMRRLKTDPKVISDLPEKMEMKVYCNLTREQVTLYEAVVKDMMQTLENDTDENDMKRRGMILSGLMKLKQLCNHPALFLHDNSELDGRSGKLQRLVEMLEEVIAERDKALIFTQFTEMGEALRKYLSSKLRCDILYLHGGVAQKNRDKMVSSFQSDADGAPIFIISIKAGGTGLNLTKANHVFHFDRWWNPAVEDQATDRAFRIGQKRNVQVHKFVCSGTLEEQIDQLIEKKKSLAQNIIGASENWITELSNGELQKMITLRRDDAISADEG